MINDLQNQLDSLDLKERQHALASLLAQTPPDQLAPDKPTSIHNLHFHTFFSFNCCGYSPTKIAYLAKKTPLAFAGIVDFDVLDGLDEFLAASKQLNLKSTVGIESRVFVPQFAGNVINSPGEPGIAYHMGVGFTTNNFDQPQIEFLKNLKTTAQNRNKALTQRVNDYLSEIALDYDTDVIPLTPAANPTERHICLAFTNKARKVFPDDKKLADYWTQKLNTEIKIDDLSNSVKLINTIRAKTMKRGGVGYVKPDAGDFPKMADMNAFSLAAGAIPTLAWLDGTSDGEQQMEKLLNIAMQSGVAAVNIIPDRNFTPGQKDIKLKNLCDFVDLTKKYDLPVFVGTEMNSPGQKFVDAFETQELKPLVPVFLYGARIAYAHSALQSAAKLGYTSTWAKNNFTHAADKNKFYEEAGSLLSPSIENCLTNINQNFSPEIILKTITEAK